MELTLPCSVALRAAVFGRHVLVNRPKASLCRVTSRINRLRPGTCQKRLFALDYRLLNREMAKFV